MPAAEDVDLRGWKIVIGGSALPKALAKTALERGIDVFTGYGMSETCPMLTLAQLKPEALGGTADEQLDLRTQGGPAASAGRSAHRRRRHERRCRTTASRPARSWCARRGSRRATSRTRKPPRRCGRAATCTPGHRQSIDADGYLQITDRLKDVIKTGGEWVSSLEVEDLI